MRKFLGELIVGSLMCLFCAGGAYVGTTVAQVQFFHTRGPIKVTFKDAAINCEDLEPETSAPPEPDARWEAP